MHRRIHELVRLHGEEPVRHQQSVNYFKIDLNQISTKKIVQDVATRWNSTYYMLERLMEQKRAISVFTAENNFSHTLSGNQWDLIDNTLKLLKPFEEITKAMSSSEAIISEILPTLKVLNTYLEQETCFGVGTMKEILINSLRIRFPEIELNNNFVLSTFMDPRFKSAFFDEPTKLYAMKEFRRIYDDDIENNHVETTADEIDDGTDDDADDLPLSSRISAPLPKKKEIALYGITLIVLVLHQQTFPKSITIVRKK